MWLDLCSQQHITFLERTLQAKRMRGEWKLHSKCTRTSANPFPIPGPPVPLLPVHHHKTFCLIHVWQEVSPSRQVMPVVLHAHQTRCKVLQPPQCNWPGCGFHFPLAQICKEKKSKKKPQQNTRNTNLASSVRG